MQILENRRNAVYVALLMSSGLCVIYWGVYTQAKSAAKTSLSLIDENAKKGESDEFAKEILNNGSKENVDTGKSAKAPQTTKADDGGTPECGSKSNAEGGKGSYSNNDGLPVTSGISGDINESNVTNSLNDAEEELDSVVSEDSSSSDPGGGGSGGQDYPLPNTVGLENKHPFFPPRPLNSTQASRNFPSKLRKNNTHENKPGFDAETLPKPAENTLLGGKTVPVNKENVLTETKNFTYRLLADGYKCICPDYSPDPDFKHSQKCIDFNKPKPPGPGGGSCVGPTSDFHIDGKENGARIISSDVVRPFIDFHEVTSAGFLTGDEGSEQLDDSIENKPQTPADTDKNSPGSSSIPELCAKDDKDVEKSMEEGVTAISKTQNNTNHGNYTDTQEDLSRDNLNGSCVLTDNDDTEESTKKNVATICETLKSGQSTDTNNNALDIPLGSESLAKDDNEYQNSMEEDDTLISKTQDNTNNGNDTDTEEDLARGDPNGPGVSTDPQINVDDVNTDFDTAETLQLDHLKEKYTQIGAEMLNTHYINVNKIKFYEKTKIMEFLQEKGYVIYRFYRKLPLNFTTLAAVAQKDSSQTLLDTNDPQKGLKRFDLESFYKFFEKCRHDQNLYKIRFVITKTDPFSFKRQQHSRPNSPTAQTCEILDKLGHAENSGQVLTSEGSITRSKTIGHRPEGSAPSQCHKSDDSTVTDVQQENIQPVSTPAKNSTAPVDGKIVAGSEIDENTHHIQAPKPNNDASANCVSATSGIPCASLENQSGSPIGMDDCDHASNSSSQNTKIQVSDKNDSDNAIQDSTGISKKTSAVLLERKKTDDLLLEMKIASQEFRNEILASQHAQSQIALNAMRFFWNDEIEAIFKNPGFERVFVLKIKTQRGIAGEPKLATFLEQQIYKNNTGSLTTITKNLCKVFKMLSAIHFGILQSLLKQPEDTELMMMAEIFEEICMSCSVLIEFYEKNCRLMKETAVE